MSLSRFVTFDFRQSASKFSCPIPTPHYFLRPPYLFFAERSVSAERVLKEGRLSIEGIGEELLNKEGLGGGAPQKE